MRRILLLEDDLILGETLQELLIEEEFNVTWVKDGNEALDATFYTNFSLYLIDINVPFINGFELLQSLRESGNTTPSIFITAKVDIESITKGFEIGADDYIKKPFDFDELLIRIKTQIRKSFNSYNSKIIYKNLTYDIDKNRIFQNDKEIKLSISELKLVELFFKNIEKTLKKEDIIDFTHNGEEGSEASLRVQISKIKKLGLNIVNQRGMGYRCEKA